MKKFLLALAATTTIGMSMSHAQTPQKRYNVTYSTGGTYAALSGATDIGFAADWDDTVSNNITLPFAFKYQNVPVSTVAIETYGSLILNGALNEDMGMGHITGLYMDYVAAGRGKIYYTTTGTAGNRIFKVEYRNVGRYLDNNGTDSLNFQIWLYENNNAIEYRAGYSNVAASQFATSLNDMMNDKEALLCGLLGNAGDSLSVTTDSSFIHATQRAGAAFSDTAIALSDFIGGSIPDPTVMAALLHGTYPPNGSVIRFVPAGTTGIAKIDFDMASVYPNPSKDGVYNISLKEAPKSGATLTIYDMTGKAVLNQSLNQANTKIDLGAYANGNYFGKIVNGDRVGGFKLIKE